MHLKVFVFRCFLLTKIENSKLSSLGCSLSTIFNQSKVKYRAKDTLPQNKFCKKKKSLMSSNPHSIWTYEIKSLIA